MSFADFDGAEEIRRAWMAGLAPDPALTVSEWADRHRMLSSRGAAEAGPYRTARTPYMRAIMDALSPSSPARRVIFAKGAQVGGSEAGNNWMGYVIHHAPGPFLLVQPTMDTAKRFSQQRIEPLIDESEALRALVAPSRARDSGNTVLSKKFPGGVLLITGANSAVGLRSMPARNVFLDEVDAYPGDLDGEGDPITLAAGRTLSYGHRAKMFLVSTPTIAGLSRIEREWDVSDQRRYHIPCPECGGLQWLKFERLRWPKGRPDEVAYICEHCEAPIEERHKPYFMAEENGATWIPTAPPEVAEAAAREGVVGFHISGLYSPLGWLSWRQIAAKWEAAQGRESELKTFKNTILGAAWQERGEAPDWERLYERREDGQLGRVPRGGLVLTAGADVQRDRIEVDVWAWGPGLESWLVDHLVLHGDPAAPDVWRAMDALLGQEWPHQDGGSLRLDKLAIDTGDGQNTDAVYGWARRAGLSQVMAIKGVRAFNRTMPVEGPTYVEVTVGGRKLKRGLQLWTIAVSVFKSETYRWLRLVAPTDEEAEGGALHPPGFVHIPRDGVTAEWVKQLTAEQLVLKRDRKRGFQRLEWEQTRDRNEALDNRVYARAAAWLIGLDRWTDRQWDARRSRLAPSTPAAPAAPSGARTAPQQRPSPPAGKSGRKNWFR